MAKVFAGMSDGLVAVYSLVEDLPLDGETYLCSHTLNKTIFGLKDSDPRQRPYPVSTIALVSSGTQVRCTVTANFVFVESIWTIILKQKGSSVKLLSLSFSCNCLSGSCRWPHVHQVWFSNGPGVLVIDTTSLHAVQRIESYSPPSSIVTMATSFSLWGEEAVWTLDDHTNTLLLYHAASYELCAKY